MLKNIFLSIFMLVSENFSLPLSSQSSRKSQQKEAWYKGKNNTADKQRVEISRSSIAKSKNEDCTD